MNVDKAIQAASVVPSWTSEDERRQVGALAYDLIDGSKIVEIGCLYGGSTAVMGLASPKSSITVIDDFSWNPNEYPEGSRAAFQKNMDTFDIHVNIIEGDSRQIGKIWKDPIDLLVIDGGHSYEYIRADLELFAPKAEVVVCHDWDNPAWPSVRTAIEEFLKTDEGRPFSIVNVTGMMVTLMRNVSDPSLFTTFSGIYETNQWASTETRSGGGSEMKSTVEIRAELAGILNQYKINSLLDAGCGDWNWMNTLDLSGAQVWACDIVPSMIAENKRKYGNLACFFRADLVHDDLPAVDLILCRATLFHLSLAHVAEALANMKRSAKYLLTTTHVWVTENEDIADGQWRRLNLLLPPFNLPPPLLSFYDGSGNDGSLALWKTSDIP